MKEFRKALFQIVGKELSEQETLDCWITLIELIKWYQKVYENHKDEFNIEFPADEISAIETNIAMENYDFSSKQVVPFATSGGSGMGDSGSIMQKLAPKAKVDSGKRFNSRVSKKDLKTWAEKWL